MSPRFIELAIMIISKHRLSMLQYILRSLTYILFILQVLTLLICMLCYSPISGCLSLRSESSTILCLFYRASDEQRVSPAQILPKMQVAPLLQWPTIRIAAL